MDLREYFETHQGQGVLATADRAGKVDASVYARPHVLDAVTVAFVMPERATYANLQANHSAAYLFKEDCPRWRGVRLQLTKVGEESDPAAIRDLCKGPDPVADGGAAEARRLVLFRVEHVLPLVGA